MGDGRRQARAGSYAEQAEAFKARKVDGVFAILAPPAAAVLDASAGRALMLLPCPGPLIEHLATVRLGRGVIRAGNYPKAINGGEDATAATMSTTIIVSTAMSDGVAYTITKTINDNAERFRALHVSLAEYDPSRGWSQLGVPLHPGPSGTIAKRAGSSERSWVRRGID